MKYWNICMERSHCAGWFWVQLARASHGDGGPTTPQEENDRIHALRKRIDELPVDELTWVLLWLNGEEGSEDLVTEDELIELCKQVGPDKLLLMLENKIPSDDPDLKPRKDNNWFYQRMILFVLQHADQLLRREDSDVLRTYELMHRDFKTPWWAFAAARLKPDNASKILHSAIERFQGEYYEHERVELYVALWQMAGRPELMFILDWFFEENRECCACSSSLFIEVMSKADNGRFFISRIIQDPRWNEIDWEAIEKLVRIVNIWLDKPIITENELREAHHILGNFCNWSGADTVYPEETAELRTHLSEWQYRLTLSIPDWLDSDLE